MALPALALLAGIAAAIAIARSRSRQDDAAPSGNDGEPPPDDESETGSEPVVPAGWMEIEHPFLGAVVVRKGGINKWLERDEVRGPPGRRWPTDRDPRNLEVGDTIEFVPRTGDYAEVLFARVSKVGGPVGGPAWSGYDYRAQVMSKHEGRDVAPKDPGGHGLKYGDYIGIRAPQIVYWE